MKSITREKEFSDMVFGLIEVKKEVVSMIKINGSWVNQEDLKREELSQILEKKLDETMKNIGFERRKTA